MSPTPSLSVRTARALFRALSWIGAPFGGVRPHRLCHYLAQRGYGGAGFSPQDQRWHRDRWGNRFLLHPHYFIDRHIIAFGAYEVDLIAMLRARLAPGMVCMDVGAHLGEATVHMARGVAPGGRVHAFEPVPHLLERVRTHVRANGLDALVELHAIALSDVDGTALFHVVDPVASNQGQGSLFEQDLPAGTSRIEVRTMRLDEFVERHGIERLDLMKIDVQGAEPLLLRGGTRSLERLGPDLLIEVSPEDLRGSGSDSGQLLRALEELGYALYETKRGRLTRRVRAREAAADYASGNLYCTRRSD